MTTVREKIAAVSAALFKQPPFCTGIVEIDGYSSTLFYKKDGKGASFLSLTSADDEDLEALSNACLPPSELENQDISNDESCEARKMEVEDFRIAFDPSPIVEVVKAHLLDGESQDIDLDWELYQLNVFDY